MDEKTYRKIMTSEPRVVPTCPKCGSEKVVGAEDVPGLWDCTDCGLGDITSRQLVPKTEWS